MRGGTCRGCRARSEAALTRPGWPWPWQAGGPLASTLGRGAAQAGQGGRISEARAGLSLGSGLKRKVQVPGQGGTCDGCLCREARAAAAPRQMLSALSVLEPARREVGSAAGRRGPYLPGDLPEARWGSVWGTRNFCWHILLDGGAMAGPLQVRIHPPGPSPLAPSQGQTEKVAWDRESQPPSVILSAGPAGTPPRPITSLEGLP